MHSPLKIPIHVIDFEGNQRCGIIEYGVVTLQGNVVTDTRTRLCQAQAAIAAQDVRHHGIRNMDTERCAPFAEEWDYFIGLRKSGPLCAHHATVENMLLKSIWAYPSQSPDFLRVGQTCSDWGPWIDTCRLFQMIYPDLESYKLAALIAGFGLQDVLRQHAAAYCPAGRNKYHCALYDAIASALLLQHVLALPGYGAATIAWLLHNSAGTKTAREKQQQQRLWRE